MGKKEEADRVIADDSVCVREKRERCSGSNKKKKKRLLNWSRSPSKIESRTPFTVLPSLSFSLKAETRIWFCFVVSGAHVFRYFRSLVFLSFFFSFPLQMILLPHRETSAVAEKNLPFHCKPSRFRHHLSSLSAVSQSVSRRRGRVWERISSSLSIPSHAYTHTNTDCLVVSSTFDVVTTH